MVVFFFCFLFLSLSGHNGDNGGVIILFINFLAGGIAANLVLVVVFDGGGDGHNMDMEQDLKEGKQQVDVVWRSN